MAQQGSLSRGIYELNDPAGTLLAVKVPYSGSADLYDGTRVIVRPNQTALFLYNGKLTEVLGPGSHDIRTENFPLLTRLANWRFGFESPLRCDLWFVSQQLFQGRRWGTASPVLHPIEGLGTLPLRAHGNYNVRIADPKGFFLRLIGSQSAFDVTELETFIQGQIQELLPKALAQVIRAPKDLNTRQDEVSVELERLLMAKIRPYGLAVEETQVLAIVPPKEVLEALEERIAMDLVGDKREYLLYKIANSLEQIGKNPGSGAHDSTQVMMSLMLSKGLLGSDFHQREESRQEKPTGQRDDAKPAPAPGRALPQARTCPACSEPAADASARFCAKCGVKL